MEGYVHPDFGAVTEVLRKVVRHRRGGGAAVAVVHHGETVVDVWTGARDSAGHPWRRDTVAMSFSTTKGVVATVVHRLADRGLVDYDEPVATYWPEFAAAGKDRVEVHHLLSHSAGLHDARGLVDTARNMLDWDHMVAALAAAEPRWEAGTRHGYHGLTYGWLVGELIRRVTGTTVHEAVQREIVEPLGLDGMFIGVPPADRDRLAELIGAPRGSPRAARLVESLERFEHLRPMVDAFLVDDFAELMVADDIHDAELPAVNGAFTARSLAGMYAALVTPPEVGDPFVSAETLRRATMVQSQERDRVVLFPMRWRLGYHMAGTSAGVPPRGFGHFGFGGSGAWADPDSRLAVAMVLNRVAGTPFGDTRFLRIGGAALRGARRRDRTKGDRT